jgi:hypothetical protein
MSAPEVPDELKQEVRALAAQWTDRDDDEDALFELVLSLVAIGCDAGRRAGQERMRERARSVMNATFVRWERPEYGLLRSDIDRAIAALAIEEE